MNAEQQIKRTKSLLKILADRLTADPKSSFAEITGRVTLYPDILDEDEAEELRQLAEAIGEETK